jgi:hypothetical protein
VKGLYGGHHFSFGLGKVKCDRDGGWHVLRVSIRNKVHGTSHCEHEGEGNFGIPMIHGDLFCLQREKGGHHILE